MIVLLRLLVILSTAGGCLLASRTLMHYFQLESYQFPGYFRTIRRNIKKAVLLGIVLLLPVLLAACLIYTSGERPGVLRVLAVLACVALTLCAGYAMHQWGKKQKAKKALALTPRMKRLHVVAVIVFALVTWAMMSVWAPAVALMPLLLPVWFALGGLLAWPIEKLISEMYFRDAQHILARRPDLIKIGITGSYGKTSVKFILGTILQERFQTLVTPSSFNTPMGVTKIIRNNLSATHQVFVAEMGARHVGDIKEMCRLVHPRYGVLTSVGPQHLDTFKTLERIKSTKYELMDAVPADGCCFFPQDGAICSELYSRTQKEKVLASIHGQADVWAQGITVSPEGSAFTLCCGDDRVQCTTRLLGEHNIQNIVLAASVGLKLGMTLNQVSRGIARVQPVEHRLQLSTNRAGMTVIDDAFNSNPAGASCALKVLKEFNARRIIITPGMVELGSREAELNRAFGRQMAESTDIAILVGRRHTEPIAEGLREAGFPESAMHVVSSLDEAAALLVRIGQKGDVVLFENDLPDNYSE